MKLHFNSKSRIAFGFTNYFIQGVLATEITHYYNESLQTGERQGQVKPLVD